MNSAAVIKTRPVNYAFMYSVAVMRVDPQTHFIQIYIELWRFEDFFT